MIRWALLCGCALFVWLVGELLPGVSAAQDTPEKTDPALPEPTVDSAMAARVAQRMLTRQDQNSDGKLSAEETVGLFRTQFAAFDKDADGFLDRSELEQALSRIIGLTEVNPAGARFDARKAWAWPDRPRPKWELAEDVLPTEALEGEGIWVDPAVESAPVGPIQVTVWFDRQFLGDGAAYVRRSQEFSGEQRQELAGRVINTLKTLSQQSFEAAEPGLRKLIEENQIQLVQWHWIVNGFTCVTNPEHLPALKQIPGVKKIFANPAIPGRGNAAPLPQFYPPEENSPYDPERYQHPWYHRYLLADRARKQLKVSGAGTLNIIMDGNFVCFPNVTGNLYRHPEEVPGNGTDDDGNGLIDDYHGYNFDQDSAALEMVRGQAVRNISGLHGTLCAAEICGTGTEKCPYEFGLAPAANWAGVIGSWNKEAAFEWAVEQGAETVSMSFSIPALGESRSHWRKMIEQAAFCGVCSVSGAGNFAGEGTRVFAPIPVQMRTPEDIPLAAFAPAGVQRTFERTPFSSQGPVEWKTEHYQEGLVQKPDFCAFNTGLPVIYPNGTVLADAANGNSFAGPMMAGTLALMFSADPDLLPWDAREILIQTATDVADPGFDSQTGHGLLNCYRAVREVLRRKAVREGADPKPFEGREENDELDIPAIQEELKPLRKVAVYSVQANSAAAKAGLRAGDVIESIGDTPIASRPDVPKTIAQSRDAKRETEVFVILRKGEKLEISVSIPATGPIGIASRDTLQAPAFE